MNGLRDTELRDENEKREDSCLWRCEVPNFSGKFLKEVSAV